MFSFRNRLSPTTSQMFRFSSSPVTISLHPALHDSSAGSGNALADAVNNALALHAALLRTGPAIRDTPADTGADMRRAVAGLTMALMGDVLQRLDNHDPAPARGPAIGTSALRPASSPAAPANATNAAVLALGLAGALLASRFLSMHAPSPRRLHTEADKLQRLTGLRAP